MPIELIEEALQHGKATCVAFNRRGTLLAAGTAAGSVQVWDFQTRSVARELVSDSAEESAAILSVAWSRDGRKLMSSAADGSLTVWDVAEADDVFRHTFDAPLHRAQFNPDNPSLALVCPSDDGPMTFALGRGRKRTPLPQMPGGIDVLPSCAAPSERGPGHLRHRAAAHLYKIRRPSSSGKRFAPCVRASRPPRWTSCRRVKCRTPRSSNEWNSAWTVGDCWWCPARRRCRSVTAWASANESDAGAKVSGVPPRVAVLTPAGSFANHASRGQWSAAAFTRDGERVLGASAGARTNFHVWPAGWRRGTSRVGRGGGEGHPAQLEAHPRDRCASRSGRTG